MIQNLLNVLREMNWHFGRGDFVRVAINADGTTGQLIRRIPTTQTNGFEESRRITIIDGRKVRFAGRTRVFQ